MADSPDVLQSELAVTVRGERYAFKIPSITYEIEVAARAAHIRRLADPSSSAAPYELGGDALRLSIALARLELYLTGSSVAWPFSEVTKGGPPAVNHLKFPRDKARLAVEVGEAFREEFERFLDAGAADDDKAGS